MTHESPLHVPLRMCSGGRARIPLRTRPKWASQSRCPVYPSRDQYPSQDQYPGHGQYPSRDQYPSQGREPCPKGGSRSLPPLVLKGIRAAENC